jgi:hypothetical protein
MARFGVSMPISPSVLDWGNAKWIEYIRSIVISEKAALSKLANAADET